MIEYYVGVEGPTIVVESPQDLITAIDILHTQVLDNLGERHPCMAFMQKMLDECRAVTGLEPQ